MHKSQITEHCSLGFIVLGRGTLETEPRFSPIWTAHCKWVITPAQFYLVYFWQLPTKSIFWSQVGNCFDVSSVTSSPHTSLESLFPSCHLGLLAFHLPSQRTLLWEWKQSWFSRAVDLAQWLRTEDRSFGRIPVPILAGEQLPVTPASGASNNSGLRGTCTHVHIPIRSYTHIHVTKVNLLEKSGFSFLLYHSFERTGKERKLVGSWPHSCLNSMVLDLISPCIY